MFKLVVLSALLALVSAKPGYLHGGYALPSLSAAVSSSSRVDLGNQGIAVQAAPVVSQPTAVLAASPTASAQVAPTGSSVYSNTISHGPAIAIPTAVSHQSRVDVHHAGHQLVHTIRTVPTIIQLPALHGGFAGHY